MLSKTHSFCFLVIALVVGNVLFADTLDLHVKGSEGEPFILVTPVPDESVGKAVPDIKSLIQKALENVKKSPSKSYEKHALPSIPNCYTDETSKKVSKSRLEKIPELDYLFLDSRHRSLTVDTAFGEYAQPFYVDKPLGANLAKFLNVPCTPYRIVVFAEKDNAAVTYKGDDALILIGVKRDVKQMRKNSR